MPFITQDRRKIIDHYDNWQDIIACGPQPGDLCYVHYKTMVDKWKANPRWTMAHEIYKEVEDTQPYDRTNDDWIAKSLAWQVFFIKYVMKYEDQKEQENGTI